MEGEEEGERGKGNRRKRGLGGEGRDETGEKEREGVRRVREGRKGGIDGGGEGEKEEKKGRMNTTITHHFKSHIKNNTCFTD